MLGLCDCIDTNCNLLQVVHRFWSLTTDVTATYQTFSINITRFLSINLSESIFTIKEGRVNICEVIRVVQTCMFCQQLRLVS